MLRFSTVLGSVCRVLWAYGTLMIVCGGEHLKHMFGLFQSLGCQVVTHGVEEHATGSVNSSSSEGDAASEVTQDIVKDNDSCTVANDSELRRRRAKLAAGPSTGSTVLLQEEYVKNSEERHAKELQASRKYQGMQYTLRPSNPTHKRLRESPLSSDAIFSQVCAFSGCTYF
jgi:hypothetical protein